MVLRQYTIVLWTMLLLGGGCTKSSSGESQQGVHGDAEPAPPQAAPDAATGFVAHPDWPSYENPAWSVALAYPDGWYLRERTVEEIGNPDELWLDFSAEPIAPLPEADPVYSMTLIVSVSRTLADVLADYRLNPELEEEEVMIAGVPVRKLSYPADLLEGAPVAVYLLEQEGNVYDISGLEELPELSTVVESLVAGGGQ